MSPASWNFDISKAPRGRYEIVNRRFGKTFSDMKVFVPEPVILASKCGKVIKSRYIPDEKRWECFQKGEQPIAWMPWPSHPASVDEAAA